MSYFEPAAGAAPCGRWTRSMADLIDDGGTGRFQIVQSLCKTP
jgi:hypothetical protein